MESNQEKLEELKAEISKFSADRDWDKFHSPKNLSMALAGEVGELLEHFQWLSEKESSNLNKEKKEAVALEIADIFIYLLRLSQILNIDILKYSKDKMTINKSRYPIDKVKGDSRRAEEY